MVHIDFDDLAFKRTLVKIRLINSRLIEGFVVGWEVYHASVYRDDPSRNTDFALCITVLEKTSNETYRISTDLMAEIGIESEAG